MEADILLWIQNNIRNDVLTPIFKFITTLGNAGVIWIVLSVGLLIPKKTRRVGALALVSLVFSALIDNVILKNVVARTRPYDVIEGLTSLVGAQKDYSFPSGHTGSAFAAAVVMFLGLPKKCGIPILVFACLMGLSRLYVGVHYPSDVLGGALIGTGIALFTYWFGTVRIEQKA
jgi:membrane-associated phospholipid phosphatase